MFLMFSKALHDKTTEEEKLKYCEVLKVLPFKVTFFYFNIFSNVIYTCDGKAEFSASYFQSAFQHHIFSHMILQE